MMRETLVCDVSTFRALRAEKSSFLFPACCSLFLLHTLSDDNGKMDPHCLAVWTSIGVNYSTYKPTDEEILARYLLKFSKGGKTTAAELHQDDLGLLDPSGDSEGYLVQAASGAIEL